MNKIILNYLLKNFLKTVLMWVMIFYCFGVILNLFEEIEFFIKYKCKYFHTFNFNQYIYTQYDNTTFTFYYLYIEYVVYDQNKK